MHVHIHYECDEDDGLGDAVVVGELNPPESRTLHRDLSHARQDALFFDAHRDELLAKYAEHWVAVYGKRVVAVAEQLHDLFSRIDANGVPREHVHIEYVTDEDDDLVICWP